MRDDKIIIKVDEIEFESTIADAIDMLFQLLRLRDAKAAHPLTPDTAPSAQEPAPTTPPIYAPFYLLPYPPLRLWPPQPGVSKTTIGDIRATP